MIWLGLLGVTLFALAPVLWVIWRPVSSRGRRDAALALHQAQLAELDRELAEGRLLPGEHGAAKLEVQRRLLAEAASEDQAPVRASRWPLIYALLLVPAAALGLYLVQGQPGMPAQPLAPRQAEWAQEDVLIDRLKARLAELPTGDPRAYDGYVLLGDAEEKRARLDEAFAAWIKALSISFDANLAARAAEAHAESIGQVDDLSADLFKRALAAAPADAPWRDLAEQRLTETRK